MAIQVYLCDDVPALRLARNEPEAAEAIRTALLEDVTHEPGSLRRETPAGASFYPFRGVSFRGLW